MANTFAPFGFQQASGTGSAPTYEQVTGLIASGYSTAIYFGDPVYFNQSGTGYLEGSSITPGTQTTGIAGIFVGCTYLSTSQKRTVWSNYWPGSDANGDVTAYYVNDPNAKFRVQVGPSGTGPIAIADIGANVQFAYGTGNSASGISGAYIAAVGTATTTTLPFRIVSLVVAPPGANGTDTTSANNIVIVSFNNVGTRNLSGI
jgi:hypothetical protein